MNDIDYMHLPRLRLEHPNRRGSGSALQMFLVPATACEAGHIRIEIADQSSTSRFDWGLSAWADLGAVDLAKLLMVFTGWIEGTVDDGSGDNRIHLKSEDGKVFTSVDLRHNVEPGPTYCLTVERNVIGERISRMHIKLSNAEALAISTAIQGALHTVAFGVPVLREVR